MVYYCTSSERDMAEVHNLLLHMVYYWTSSERDMAEVHISIWELLPECESVQLHAFYGKGAYILQLASCVCLSLNSKFVDNSFITAFLTFSSGYRALSAVI